MAGSRTWINREEIAEIYESLASKNLFDEKSSAYLDTADDIRATDRLGKQIGNRT